MKKSRVWRRPAVDPDKIVKIRAAVLKRKSINEEEDNKARAEWEEKKKRLHQKELKQKAAEQQKLTSEERQAEIKVLESKLEELGEHKHAYFLRLKKILKGEEEKKSAERQKPEELQAKEAQLQQQQNQNKPAMVQRDHEEAVAVAAAAHQSPRVDPRAAAQQPFMGAAQARPVMPTLMAMPGNVMDGSRPMYSMARGMPVPVQPINPVHMHGAGLMTATAAVQGRPTLFQQQMFQQQAQLQQQMYMQPQMVQIGQPVNIQNVSINPQQMYRHHGGGYVQPYTWNKH
eukprot:TRINITY_DN36889_c0_g1_i1.p1 TRINITY_DN36889_c0_g1~~TRINITY_DN36889_c0_g1_i1.p1  ORF type:complete len:287 (+),score=81.48 TRINITY_DN36889_c0_g1_i1:209-1069(+)